MARQQAGNPLRVFALAGQNAVEMQMHVSAQSVQQGSTPNFVVAYDNSLGAKGQTLASALLATCEDDYQRLLGYFGDLTPQHVPFHIEIIPGSKGARHASCGATAIHCDAFKGTDANLVRALFVAEVDEVLMAWQDAGWDCGASNGEGLSRILAGWFYPAEHHRFATAATWLNHGRPDYVSHNDGTDTHKVSIGCATLFINYLRYQLHFSLATIIQCAGATLHQTYVNLTGADDAFASFSSLIARHYPSGTAVRPQRDNIFPLLDPAAWGTWESLNAEVISPPSVVSWAPDRLDLFALGPDQSVQHQWYGHGAWSTWESLGGTLAGAPSAVSWAPNRLDVFARGTDNAIYHNWWGTNGWGGWAALGGTFETDPVAVSWAPNRLDVFALGTDQALWHQWWDGTRWGAWESLGGTLAAPPAVASWGPNRLDIVALGPDQALWHVWYDGANGWGTWESLGGTLASPPAMVAWDEERLDIVARGPDQAVWHLWYARAAGWSAWESLGGTITTPPSLVSWAPNRLDIFGLGPDQAVQHQWYGQGDWGSWESLGGPFIAPPQATCWAANRIDLVAGAVGRSLYHQWWG